MGCSSASSNIHVSFMERFGAELFGWYVTCDLTASTAIYRCSPLYQMEVHSYTIDANRIYFIYNFCYAD